MSKEDKNIKDIKVWTDNAAAVEASILAGEEHEPILTEYGANEFAVDFLRRGGLWEHLLVKPKEWKDNGKDWKKLGGIAILKELLHVGHLAQADKVIKDAKLMRELGFTISEVETAKEQDKGIIHRDTLRNYFKAIPYQQSIREFYDFVNFMREKKWVRGRTYVADGLEIEVYGKTYEGIGKVWDDKEKRWKYGYKAVLLMNVEEDRERLLGLAIGPINSDERELLLQIFKDLEKYVGKIKDIMDVIILDRGYWGYDFMEETIVKGYGIDYVVIAKKSFMFVKEDLRHMIDSRQIKFQERQLYNRTRKEWEPVKVAFVKDLMHGYKNKEQPYLGLVNVVVMKYMEGKEEKEVFYVTNRKAPKNPLKIVQLYGDRWTIENQGNRDLSHRWLIRIPAGRTLNAITARICLILKLYNAMKIMEMKHGKEWQENKEEIKAWGERSFIAGHGLIVYAREHFTILSPKRYGKLVEARTREATIEELKQKVKGYLPRDKVEELFKKLSR
jgi:hypothetical protein